MIIDEKDVFETNSFLCDLDSKLEDFSMTPFFDIVTSFVRISLRKHKGVVLGDQLLYYLALNNACSVLDMIHDEIVYRIIKYYDYKEKQYVNEPYLITLVKYRCKDILSRVLPNITLSVDILHKLLDEINSENVFVLYFIDTRHLDNIVMYITKNKNYDILDNLEKVGSMLQKQQAKIVYTYPSYSLTKRS